LMFLFTYHNFFTSEDNTSDWVGPYNDLDVRWYLSIGLPIVMAIFLQIFLPHFGLLV
jgi:hypothetical protein